MADFEVKIATDLRDIVEAQRLRFQVFNLESLDQDEETEAGGEPLLPT